MSPASTSTGAQPQAQTHTLSTRVRKTIQSIKEIVGDFSDADIYMALRETNMDPNETTQKLLSQDPFHEVKRKRDKKRESMGYKGSMASDKRSDNFNQGTKFHILFDRSARQPGYARNDAPSNMRINRAFRVVRDNRANGSTNRELNPALLQGTASTNEQGFEMVTERGPAETSSNLKPSSALSSSQSSNGPTVLQPRHTRHANSIAIDKKLVLEEKQTTVPSGASRVQAVKSNNSQHLSAPLTLSNSVVGVYSSSTDPVHVPSPNSRSSAAVGAIKREVGVVGGHRQSSENATKDSSPSSSSVLGRRASFSESFRPFPSISKMGQGSKISVTEPVMPGISVNRSFLSNQYNSRPHQPSVGHQKATHHNKEWKLKSSQKSSAVSPGVIGTPPVHISEDLESDAAGLQDRVSGVNINENKNVVIAQHIRVAETDRCRLTFGSFRVEFDSSLNFASELRAIGVTEESNGESAARLLVSALESSCDDASGSKQVELIDDQVRNSGSNSPSGTASEHQSPDKASSPPNLDHYADIGLVQRSSPSYSESQKQPEPAQLPGFSAFDPRTSYDISYFRPIDEAVRGQGLPSPQEALSSHTASSISGSMTPMLQQQQQPPTAQMYPPVHVSHFANLMPYQQFLSPVYVPQMTVPGYSNPAYLHPSNGSSYLLMPGGSSHLTALKYGIQQFKPVPSSSPTGFGNFTNPTGYAISASGVIGSVTGLEDSSRIKYNPQAEASENWIHNPRDRPGLQSGPYYNMTGQTPHAAYLPSHTSHACFNSAAAQSSHMQFQGLYPPPPQPSAMANPHHLGPVIGGNVGVGVAPVAPGAQVGAYQQPQLGHLNWTTNF